MDITHGILGSVRSAVAAIVLRALRVELNRVRIVHVSVLIVEKQSLSTSKRD